MAELKLTNDYPGDELAIFLYREDCKILKEELSNHCFSMENKQKTSEIMKLIMELADD